MTLEVRHHLFRLFYSVVKFDDYLLKRSISIRISSTRGKRGHGPIECLADREGKKKKEKKKEVFEVLADGVLLETPRGLGSLD